MASADDVAAYILAKSGGSMTTMKLQKLLYYSQAWSLVWDQAPLFEERIEAWANGPVVPEIFVKHQGRYQLSQWKDGDPEALTVDQRETVDAVMDYYGQMHAQILVHLTHQEDPWKNARRGIPDGIRGNKEIPLDEIADYYSRIYAELSEKTED